MDIFYEDSIVLEGEQGQNAPAADGDGTEDETIGAAAGHEDGAPVKMLFTVNGDDYELTYTKLRIRHIEERLDRSIATIMAKIEGGELPKLSDMYVLFAGGFKKVDGGYVSFEQGAKIAEEAIEEESYLRIIKYIIYALERDCPFLFRID